MMTAAPSQSDAGLALAGMAKDATDGAVDAGKDMAKDAMGMDKN